MIEKDLKPVSSRCIQLYYCQKHLPVTLKKRCSSLKYYQFSILKLQLKCTSPLLLYSSQRHRSIEYGERDNPFNTYAKCFEKPTFAPSDKHTILDFLKIFRLYELDDGEYKI